MKRHSLIFIVGLVVVSTAWTSRAQLAWQKDSLNPVLPATTGGANDPSANRNIYSPAVLWDSAEGWYKMWYASSSIYTGSKYCISYAISRDGSHWYQYANNPVLAPGTLPQSFDAVWMRVPSVVHVGDSYKMYYTGYDGNHQSIGLAESPDGIHWVKDPGNPILNLPGAGEPRVLNQDSLYLMIFCYVKDLYRAASRDGRAWEFDTSRAILQTDTVIPGPYLTTDGLARSDSLYYLLFGSGPGTPIRLAYSFDGWTWSKIHAPVIQSGGPSSPDYSMEFGSMILKNNMFEYWYSGYAEYLGQWQIFRATSPLASISDLTSVLTYRASTAAVSFNLDQNYPNPFNPSTTIKFELPTASHVTLKVCNALGQEVVTLVNENRPAGVYTVQFEAKGLASGVYFYRIQSGNLVETKKLILLK